MKELKKVRSLIAFFLTLTALIIIISIFGWLLYNRIRRLAVKPEYCDEFLVELTPETYLIDAQVGRGKLLKVKIINHGFEDEFSISVDGPDWVALRPTKVRLNQGSIEEIFVYISPGIGSSGDYIATVRAKSYCGEAITRFRIKV